MGDGLTRRDFLKVGTAGVALGLAGSTLGGGAAAQAPDRLRCGFIGVGGRGSGLLREVLGLDVVDIVSICDIEPGNLQRACDVVEQAAGRRPEAVGAGPYEYRKLLKSPEIDCVVIATPCYWHARMYVDALEAEKPFYGEKPIAITAREIKLLEAARKAHPNVVVTIGFQWAASRARADIVKRVKAGEIGDLLEGRFHRYNNWASLGRWFNDRALSGDWMLEQAVHEFNLIWWVIGAHPLSAYTLGRENVVEPENKERNVTDYYATLLEYPNGLMVHYAHGWISPAGYTGMNTQFVGKLGGCDVLGQTIQLREETENRQGQGPGGDTKEHLARFFECAKAKTPEAVFAGVENGIAASYIGLMIRQSLYEKKRVTFEEMVEDKTPLPPLPKET
jgi:myo-inositol 2-dehydrogenase / D-chiro-inositol 1-dehydrogenase